MKKISSQRFFHRIVLLGTPLFLAVSSFSHPGGFTADVFVSLSPITNTWIALHAAHLFLFPLLALALYFLVEGVDGWVAGMSRIAAGVFAIFSISRAAVSGLAVGVLVRNARIISPEQQDGVARAVQELYFNFLAGGQVSVITLAALLGWLVAALGAAFALYMAGAPLFSALFLIPAAVSFGLSYLPPYGPLGMLSFFLAALILERYRWDFHPLNPFSHSTVPGGESEHSCPDGDSTQ